ncbi:MAG: major capsid protein, partial [Actinobacteria bacterium]|nr:major capsid protein [Actinomycetota bacterium]
SWFFNGVLYVEDPYGTIPTDEAYFFPRGIPNMFQAFYAPADTVSDANDVAQDFYMYMLQDHRTAHIETEFSLLAVNTRPELVVRSTMS